MWFPESAHHALSKPFPEGYPYIEDLALPTIVIALLITFVRFYLSDAIFSYIGVRTMQLAPLSLDERNRRGSAETVPAAVLKIVRHIMSGQPTSKKAKTVEDKLRIHREKQRVVDTVIAQVRSQQPNTSEAQVRTWINVCKSDASRSSKLKKFNEAGWRFAFYLFIWVFGLVVLWDKPWFSDPDHNWIGYPLHFPTPDVKAYYFLSLGHYVHLMVSQFFDVKRKDFLEMLIHHVVTIFLIVFSYNANLIRIGTMVLFVHDGSDVLLELAKLFNYSAWRTGADVTFVLFAISFFVFRLVIYPMHVLNSAMFGSQKYFGTMYLTIFFPALLCMLLVLHVFWFSTIVKMMFQFLTDGLKGDARSDSESELSDQAANELPESNQTKKDK